MANLDVTPTAASNSVLANVAEDTRTAQVEDIVATTTSTGVSLGVLSASNWLFNVPFIQKTVYAAPSVTLTNQTVSTFQHSHDYIVQVSQAFASTPVILKSFTQYQQVLPTNITVFGAVNTASLLQTDAVAQVVAVVADSCN